MVILIIIAYTKAYKGGGSIPPLDFHTLSLKPLEFPKFFHFSWLILDLLLSPPPREKFSADALVTIRVA